MSGTVRFVLGGRVVEAAGVAPTTTVLDWLRAHGRRGTKEGCAEGDCGACTVVLGERAPDGVAGPRIRYRAVNACILFLPMIDGKLLLTVEDLADGDLHPVQRALVEANASQCGFCTPGFAMALFDLYHAAPAADDGAIHDALAGNLCRCTGYRPIVEAARRMHDHDDAAAAERAARSEAGLAALLQTAQRADALEIAGPDGRFLAPRGLPELAAAVARHPDATLVAGATDVGLWVTKQHRRLPVLIHLAHVPELRTVAETETHLEVGAAATYTSLLPALDRLFPAFAALVRRLGAAQVRNAGTLGGNIANGSPIGDSMPALLALGTELVLNRDGERRTVPLDAFYLGYRRSALRPGEFVERVRIPRLRPDQRFAVWKVSKRRDQDISAVCGAFCLTLDADGTATAFRAGYGGMAATPARAAAAEAAVVGQPWTAGTVDRAMAALAQDFSPIGDARASAAYRAAVARNLLQRFHRFTVGEDAYALEDAHG
ncbi:xanthine dehydrogenase small subunit [Azospirillum sp. A39]|uniref:xanthine dehydrogenase small subunit n=1 Tax=Azospirillum sp. A39 TaxID=3462279 RepID=UPI00404598BF